jgi:phage terminase small subunit
MPVLANSKHELFAQELAKGKTADAAYVSAGYSPNRGNATTLKANQSILDRVEELLSGAAARAEVTVESLIAEAEECRAAALEAGQFAAVIAAVREKGILSGKRMERQEIRYKNESIYNLSDDELIHIIATGSGGVRLRCQPNDMASSSPILNARVRPAWIAPRNHSPRLPRPRGVEKEGREATGSVRGGRAC